VTPSPGNDARTSHFYRKRGCTLGAIDRFAHPGLPGQVRLPWWKALGQGHWVRVGSENARFQRRLLLPSVFCEGGELARITEAEAR
jgi:hypothetical protein